MKLRTMFLWTMIAAFAVSAAMGIGVLLVDFDQTGERVLASALLVGAFSLTALGSAVVLDRRVRRWVGVVGIVFSVLALADWLVVTWFGSALGWAQVEPLYRAGTALTVVAVWAPHVGLLALLPLRRRAWRLARLATWVFATLLGMMIIFVVVNDEWGDWEARVTGVLAILAACGTVVTPLLGVIERLRAGDESASIGRRVVVTLNCPRCGAEQHLPCGNRRCAQCGLRIRIDVDEPRCACGYLLYRLEGDTCPECGRSIDDAARWPAEDDGTPVKSA